MPKGTTLIINKGNIPLPSFAIEFGTLEKDLITSRYQSVENFLQIILVADTAEAEKLLYELGLMSHKNEFYKFFIERDFGLQKVPIKDEFLNKSEVDYAEMYKCISAYLFTADKDFQQLFHWIRVNDLTNIRKFVREKPNKLDQYFNLEQPHTAEKQPIFIAAYYGYTDLFQYLFNNKLYSRINADFRADVMVAAAAGGHFHLFQMMFVSFKHQLSIYREITQTQSLQDNHFSIFSNLIFLLIAIGSRRIDFIKQFNNEVEKEKIPEIDLSNFARYKKRILALVAQNTTPWQTLGAILTAKTAALHSGDLRVVEFVTQELNYSWQQQLIDITTFMKGRKFNTVFSDISCEKNTLSDLEQTLYLVCLEALQAITEKFKEEIQLKLLDEVFHAYKNLGYLALFKRAAEALITKHKDCPYAQYLQTLFEQFLALELEAIKEDSEENKENVPSNLNNSNNNNAQNSNITKRKTDDAKSIQVLTEAKIAKFSPKKTKQESNKENIESSQVEDQILSKLPNLTHSSPE